MIPGPHQLKGGALQLDAEEPGLPGPYGRPAGAARGRRAVSGGAEVGRLPLRCMYLSAAPPALFPRVAVRPLLRLPSGGVLQIDRDMSVHAAPRHAGPACLCRGAVGRIS
ncbi:hypothetical protein C2142_37780 [Streptomyces sp. CB01881]|nr:hypothetical protein C2142_37780 [Streptomyces sp. CB01881]